MLEDGDLASKEEDGLLSFLAAELPLPRVAAVPAEAEPATLLAAGAVVGLRDAIKRKYKLSQKVSEPDSPPPIAKNLGTDWASQWNVA